MTALAEAIATAGVIIWLIFVVVGIIKKTQAFYDSVRQLEIAVAGDQVWAEIILRGRGSEPNLTEGAQFRYDGYVVAMIDIRDGMQVRFSDGLMAEDNHYDWDKYFVAWAQQYVSTKTLQGIDWNYSGDIYLQIEQAIGVNGSM